MSEETDLKKRVAQYFAGDETALSSAERDTVEAYLDEQGVSKQDVSEFIEQAGAVEDTDTGTTTKLTTSGPLSRGRDLHGRKISPSFDPRRAGHEPEKPVRDGNGYRRNKPNDPKRFA